MIGKFKGMMMGIAVGDALGQPHENQPAIGQPVNAYQGVGGRTTDDWQMSAVLAKALMKAGKFDMAVMAEGHVAAYDDTTRGWGGAHRDACAALKSGTDPAESGKCVLREDKPYRGRGNGMCMKMGPMAAYHYALAVPLKDRVSQVAPLTMMTHPTSIGLSSALGMQQAIIYCLGQTPDTFDTAEFLRSVHEACLVAEACVFNETGATGDRLSERLAHLQENWYKLSPEDVAANYKGGGYAYESLPFSLAFFCMGRHDVGCVYDCVGSGGDTDTNGSMVGAMAGALHGVEIFPPHLLYKLLGFADIDLLSGQFADWCQRQIGVA